MQLYWLHRYRPRVWWSAAVSSPGDLILRVLNLQLCGETTIVYSKQVNNRPNGSWNLVCSHFRDVSVTMM